MAAVINARFAKPIDTEMVEFYAQHVDVILTLEDHVLAGGFGSAVLEAVSNASIKTPVVRIGWPDQFIEHGKPDDLRAKYGTQRDGGAGEAAAVLQARGDSAQSRRATPSVCSE